MDSYLLGIDVGTTGTKSLLFKSSGELVGHAYQGYPTATPAVGRSEQNADDWWDAVVATVHQVCADPAIAAGVRGISLSLQGGTMVPVDENFRPLRPAMVWSDIRCREQMERFAAEVGGSDTLYRKTGWGLEPGLNLMQIRWMREQEPELFQKCAMFLSVPDYISYKMTGIPAIDLSDLGINQLGNVESGDYDEELLAFAGITRKQLPRICRSGEPIGKLTAEAAQELGLTTDVVLSAGAHDQYAVALGAGACKAGDILIGTGTCWAITCIGDAADFESGLSQSVAAVPGMWGSLWSLSSGGACLEWLRKKLFADSDGSLISYDDVNTQAEKRVAAGEGLFFYPFTGRATLEKGFQKGSFVGLDMSHDRFHMLRAVMEGVAFQAVWMLEAFKARPAETGLILTGGATNSPLWCQMVADIAGLPVRLPKVADMACVGAAVLAGVGCGVFKDAAEGCSKLCVGERVVYPNPEMAAKYKVWAEQYRKTAQILGDVYAL